MNEAPHPLWVAARALNAAGYDVTCEELLPGLRSWNVSGRELSDMQLIDFAEQVWNGDAPVRVTLT